VTVPQKLTIDTPEQISIEYEIAGPGSRFMALFVDLMLQVLVAIALFIIFAITGGTVAAVYSKAGVWGVALSVLAVFLVQWGYFAIFEIVWKGQTPGKRQAGIRVINESGREASQYEAIARNLLRAVDSLPGMYAVGAIVMFISPQNKRIGDYVAGTIVVHDRKPENEAIFFNTANDRPIEAINYSTITPTDLEVIETYLQRRLDLDYDVRQQAAKKLADHFRQKCNVPPETKLENENLLEMLVRGFRDSARFRGK
jgi:uncharacterized RDD family membrane protein YckC